MYFLYNCNSFKQNSPFLFQIEIITKEKENKFHPLTAASLGTCNSTDQSKIKLIEDVICQVKADLILEDLECKVKGEIRHELGND